MTALAASTLPTFQPFTHLDADVKEDLSLDLGPCTLILGPSRSYKTAILDAIRLALTGRHRIGPHPSDLIGLAASKSKGITVSLQGPSGFANFVLRVRDGAPREVQWPDDFEGDLKKLTADDLRRVVPSEAVKDILGMGDARSREVVLKRWGPKEGVSMLPEHINADQLELWETARKAVLAEHGDDASAATVLAGIGAWMRKAAGGKTKVANKLDVDITAARRSMAEQGAGGENLEELKTLREKALKWERSELDRKRADTLRTDKTEAEKAVATLESKVAASKLQGVAQAKALEEATKAAQAKLGELTEKLQTDRAGEAFGVRLLGFVTPALATKKGCPICLSPHSAALEMQASKFSERLEARRQAIRVLEVQLDAAKAAVSAAVRAEKDGAAAASQATYAANEDLGMARATLASVTARLQEIDRATGEKYVGPSSVELSARVTKIEASAGAKSTVATNARQLDKLRLEVANAKILEKEAVFLAEGALKAAAVAASAAITRYMPAGLRCEAQVDGTKWDWCSVGLDNVPHKDGAASGGEWSALALALPIAWTEGAPLRVPIYDDTDLGCLDADQIVSFLEKLRDARQRGEITQVFVACNRPGELKGRVPSGWHVLERGPKQLVI